MQSLREIEERVLANGRIDGHELEALREMLYADGKIDRREADFLVVLHKRVQHHTPGFEKFFYQAIKDHILLDGRIAPAEVAWLEQMLFQDEKIQDEERRFLAQLRGEAREACPEFEALHKKVSKQPKEQHTSG